MSNVFKSIKVYKPKRHKFNMSHETKMSMNVGSLYPIFCQDVVPGDKFQIKSEFLIRAMPLLAPLMHRVNVYTYWFFVPNRLIFDQWEDFITGGRDGQANVLPPYINPLCLPDDVLSKFFKSGTLADYLGCPSFTSRSGFVLPYSDEPANRISLLPFNAYTLVYNEYFRDQNLTSEVGNLEVFKKGGLHDISLNEESPLYLRSKCWEKDYFTSALPWAQRGPQSTIPLTGTAPVERNFGARMTTQVLNAETGLPIPDAGVLMGAGQTNDLIDSNANFVALSTENEFVNLNKANSTITITDLRRASKLQRWLELNATGGSRYIEQILAHFGVKSSDSRLQRPEYLGGGRSPILIDDVIQTSATGSGDTPLSTQAGRAIGLNSGFAFKRFFEEHGILLGLCAIVPKPTYQQGMPRMFTRMDKYDYFWPEFERIGEQSITKGELVYNYGQLAKSIDDVRNDQTFGYAPRYSEYKYIPSSVHGAMRDSLSFWHSGRIFNSVPNLNYSFVEISPHSMDRNFAVESDLAHQFVSQFYLSVIARRPMTKYGTPSL